MTSFFKKQKQQLLILVLTMKIIGDKAKEIYCLQPSFSQGCHKKLGVGAANKLHIVYGVKLEHVKWGTASCIIASVPGPFYFQWRTRARNIQGYTMLSWSWIQDFLGWCKRLSQKPEEVIFAFLILLSLIDSRLLGPLYSSAKLPLFSCSPVFSCFPPPSPWQSLPAETMAQLHAAKPGLIAWCQSLSWARVCGSAA